MQSALPMKHINESMNHTTGAILCQPNATTYCTSATERSCVPPNISISAAFDRLVPKRMKMPGYEYEASRCTQCSHIHDYIRALITIFEGRAVHHSAARRSILIACDGDEKSSHDVREEHAKVDPVYVAKASVGRPSCT
jgi:hypothetical protein